MVYETTEYIVEVRTPRRFEGGNSLNINWHEVAVTIVYILLYGNLILATLNLFNLIG